MTCKHVFGVIKNWSQRRGMLYDRMLCAGIIGENEAPRGIEQECKELPRIRYIDMCVHVCMCGMFTIMGCRVVSSAVHACTFMHAQQNPMCGERCINICVYIYVREKKHENLGRGLSFRVHIACARVCLRRCLGRVRAYVYLFGRAACTRKCPTSAPCARCSHRTARLS